MSTPQSEGDEITQALGRFRTAWLSVGLFSLVINLLLLVPSVYMLQVYDRVLPSRNETTLWMLTALVIGLYAFSAVLDYLRAMALSRVARQIDAALTWRTFEAAFRRGLTRPQAHGTQPFADLGQLRQFFGGSALFAFFDAPWLPVYLAVIFLFSPWLGWLALGGSLLLVVLAVANEWLTRQPLALANQASLKAMQVAAGTVNHPEAVQAMGMLQALHRRWQPLHGEVVARQLAASDRANAIAALTRAVRLALQSLVLGVGALLVIDSQITPGMMIAASILVGRALQPVEQLIAVWRQWGTAREAWRRLRGLLAAAPERARPLDLPVPRGRLAVDRLSIVPPGSGEPVLQRVSFELEPGDVLGVLGPSGSGKSSLARALTGVWAPVDGTVRLDGAELDRYDLNKLGRHLGYLPQSIDLFEGSVAENIARFGPVDAARVVQAATQAGVHELVLRLPQGYDTPLGDAGSGLSGGQKQRLALARALYGDPALVVLDEPNAFLDEAGEQALVQAVRRLSERGSTVVMVTHRGSTLNVANKLLVLRDGRVQLFGPKEQLLGAQAGSPRNADGTLAAAPDPDHVA
jgi:ATP-binding cassette subfamily C exporter for protease/lipase